MADEMTEEEVQALAERYFTELVAIAYEDHLTMTSNGTDFVLDLMAHFVLGGTAYNFKDRDPSDVLAILAVVWADCQRYINAVNSVSGGNDADEA